MADDRKPLLEFERAVDATYVIDAQIAPDSAQIAYVTAAGAQDEARPQRTLWLVAADGGAPRRMMTSATDDWSPRWSPDGRFLAFLSDRRQRGEAQIYLFALAGGAVARLTDQPSGVRAIEWAPDGRMLAFATRPSVAPADPIIVGEEIAPTELWVLELPDDLGAPAGGALPPARQVSPPGLHVGGYVDAGFSWAPDGAGFVVMAGWSALLNGRIRSEMFLLSLEGDLTSLGLFEGVTRAPRLSPDGRRIAFIGAADTIPARYVLQILPASGGPAQAAAPDYIGSFYDFAWLPDSRRLLARSEEGQRQRLVVVDPAARLVRDAYPAFARPVSLGFWWHFGFSVDATGRYAAFPAADDESYGDLYLATIGGEAEPQRLTDLNPWTREYQWGETREVAWTSFDGMQIQGLLILPVGYERGRRYPMLTHIHGGPAIAWTHQLHADWHDWDQFLAQRGYAVFLPNPRGSTGRGVAFLEAIRGCYGEPDWRDIMAGVDQLIEQGVADPDQLVVGGWSGGGYLANWTIVRTNRFKAAVSGAGDANWVSAMGTIDIRAVFERYVGVTHEDPETTWRLSPIRLIKQATTPTLILIGGGDPRVPTTQGYELYAGLKSCGVEAQLVIYPREGHEITERSHQIDLLARVVDWFERHLGR